MCENNILSASANQLRTKSPILGHQIPQLRNCYVPSLLKMLNMKEHHRNRQNNFSMRYKLQQISNSNKFLEKSQKKDKIRLSCLEGSPSDKAIKIAYQKADKFIDKIKFGNKDSETTNASNCDEMNMSTSNSIKLNLNSKKYYNSVQKCRAATETYDSIKQQIIDKIKYKKGIVLNKNKENMNIQVASFSKNKDYDGSTSVRKRTRTVHYRHRSHVGNYLDKNEQKYNESEKSITKQIKKAQRYTQMSASDFMQEPESNISNCLHKKFNEYKRQSQVLLPIDESCLNTKLKTFCDMQKVFNKIQLPNRFITNEILKMKCNEIQIQKWVQAPKH